MCSLVKYILEFILKCLDFTKEYGYCEKALQGKTELYLFMPVFVIVVSGSKYNLV